MLATYLEALRLGLAAIFLTIASYSDWLRREVDDWVWIAMGLSTAPLLVADLLNPPHPPLILFCAFSIALTSSIALLIYWLGFWGGADAKALICLSIAAPTKPSLTNPPLPTQPVFPLTVLSDTAVMMVAFSTYLFLKNVLGGSRAWLFEGLEHEPLWKKLVLPFLGTRTSLRKLRRLRFVYPLEAIEVGEDGLLRRKIRLSPPLGENLDPDKHLRELVDRLNTLGVDPDYSVWVSPALPLLVFILGGFGLALFAGDLLVSVVLLLIG